MGSFMEHDKQKRMDDRPNPSKKHVIEFFFFLRQHIESLDNGIEYIFHCPLFVAF
jgi:hypothetical protein